MREAFCRRARTCNRRARRAGVRGSVRWHDVQQAWIECNDKCVYCKQPLSWKKFHLDHVIPLDRGGPNNGSNIACACETCDWDKSNMLIEEWKEKRGW